MLGRIIDGRTDLLGRTDRGPQGVLRVWVAITGALCATIVTTSGTAFGALGAAPLTDFRLEHGAVHFQAPANWHLLQQEDSDSGAMVIFHVRNPATDSKGPDRANVLVSVERTGSTGEMRAITDTLFASMFDSTGIVLGDTMPTRDTRFLFWRGQQGATPYALFDDYGRRGGMVIHVRMSLPIVAATPTSWTQAYGRDTQALLASIKVKGDPVFPGWTGHPTVERIKSK